MTEHRTEIGRLYKPDPSLPIPNDDPRCHCELEPQPGPPGDGVTIAGFAEGRVALHADCVHHGRVARQLIEGGLGQFSVGMKPMSEGSAELCAYWPGEGCMKGAMPCDEDDEGSDAEVPLIEWPAIDPGAEYKTIWFRKMEWRS